MRRADASIIPIFLLVAALMRSVSPINVKTRAPWVILSK